MVIDFNSPFSALRSGWSREGDGPYNNCSTAQNELNSVLIRMHRESIKQENELLLKSLRVPINPALPLLETPSELKPRSAQEVARRSVVLGYIIGIGFQQPGSRLKSALKQYRLYEFCSPNERRLLDLASPSKQEQINCTWMTECVQALAWCMKLVDLDLRQTCDDDLGPRFPIFSDPETFIQSAQLRPFEDIYREVDLHYRAHWACRNAQLMQSPEPLNSSAVMERRQALDWAVGVPFEWDEIPLDT